MNENELAGNDTAPDAEQVTNDADTNFKAGAIRKSTTNSILNALSQASGQQFESVEAALAYVARTSSQRGGNAQPVEVDESDSRMGREDRSTDNTDLRDQFMKLQRDLASKERALRTKELDSEILRNMGEKFDPDLQEYALQKIKSNIKMNRDGSFTIVNQKGQERYGMDGNPLTLNGLVNEIASGNPKLLKGSSSQTGSGLRMGQTQFAGAQPDAIPDYSKDPAAFNAWAARNGLGKGVGLKNAKVGVSVSAMSKKVL